jgi:carboxyl-terminal processing protease
MLNYRGIKQRAASLKRNQRFMSQFRIGAAIFALGGMFFLGIGIGNGTIAVGPDSAFRQSIQKESKQLSYDSVDKLYNSLRESYDGQLDVDKLEDGMKEGLVKAAGDPHTEYLTAEENKEFSEQLNGSFEGIGAELSKDGESIVIVAPIAGFPAEEAGLKARDIINKIDGESAFDISTTEAVKKIRGEKGTKVKLEIIRDGKLLEFEITRAEINIPSVEWEVTEDGVGIMTISRFGNDTAPLARKAADDFKSKNVKGVVLDLRGNPGGLLDAAVSLSNLWLPSGKIILEEKRDDEVIKVYKARGGAVLEDVPTVVLIDEGSASASEITAGALKDNGAATIVGIKSYGKGSVQELVNLRDGGVLKVTIARWFTPEGRNIDKEGIEPDQKVEITEDDIKAGRDPQKDAALSKLN